MAQKVKVQCWGLVWSEKVGCWISSRSGWLLELLTELKKLYNHCDILAKQYTSCHVDIKTMDQIMLAMYHALVAIVYQTPEDALRWSMLHRNSLCCVCGNFRISTSVKVLENRKYWTSRIASPPFIENSGEIDAEKPFAKLDLVTIHSPQQYPAFIGFKQILLSNHVIND